MKPVRLQHLLIVITPVLLMLALLVQACEKQPLKKEYRSVLSLPETPYDYEGQPLPDHITQRMINTGDTNNVTSEGAALGRVLFYDPALSLNNRTSCASCHLQSKAFCDPKQFSDGFLSGKTKRNSPPIQNLQLRRTGFFWDGRAATIEQQVLMPIQDHVEMGMEELDQLSAKLAEAEYYPALFESAFGSTEITTDRISLALSQFLKAIWSVQSKYDKGVATNFSNFTERELRGKTIFFEEAPCGNCHTEPNFDGYNHANIGLEMEYKDKGVADLPGSVSGSEGWFTIPSLRNVAMTAPYMHDGRFQTLEEVIEFYNSGVQDHPNLDYRLMDRESISPNEDGGFQGAPLRLHLSEKDKQALIAFLKTLSDETLLTNELYSDPFVLMEE